MKHQERYQDYRDRIEEALVRYLPNTTVLQSRLLEAMQYSLFSGGKRVRPVILLEFCRLSGGRISQALPFACALEMIHTYSLIHDDLPCMDDDTMRRGRPTNHKVFGEACAVLAGDALLSTAFETVLDPDYTQGLDPVRQIQAAHSLAWASGAFGMAGGQMLDTDPEFPISDPELLAHVHELKTGALIDAAARCGCILGGAGAESIQAAVSYARCVALAFQIRDDLLDVEGDSVHLGKSTGRDEATGKMNFYALVGREECLRLIAQLTEKASAFLSDFAESDFLIWLAEDLAGRNA